MATLPPSDSTFPEALLASAILAADAATAARNLQRVVVEFGRSPWADEALLRLTQLYFAQGDPAATVQAAERMRRDYPDSPLKPRADFWGARAYFDLKDEVHGCELVREALDGTGDDVEFKNQVTFYAARCGAEPPPVSVAAAAETTPPPSDTSLAGGAAPAAYSVQVLAVKSAAQVDEMLTRLKVMGFEARVVRDTSGLFKVRVGRYATRAEAQQAQARLRTKIGGQPFLVEEP
jgi:septal ring-binding cell division protein DamX